MPKSHFRVTSRREYDRAAVARGSTSLWIDEAEAGCHRLSLAETAMLRDKMQIGPVLRSRSLDRPKVEANVAVRCINGFTDLGMPKSIRMG